MWLNPNIYSSLIKKNNDKILLLVEFIMMSFLYLSELGIDCKSLPLDFVKLDETFYLKWRTLDHFVYKDILKYVFPFIVNVERKSFHSLISNMFRSFCKARNCDYDYFCTRAKAVMLVTIHSQLPKACASGKVQETQLFRL